jgi:N-acetylneuraminic acid mutarotase
VKGRFVVVGGEGNAAAASGVFDDVEAYDPATDAWDVLEPMLTPRHGTGAAELNGKLYVPGGATQQAFGAVDTNEVYVFE